MQPDPSLQSLGARTLSAELRGDERAWRRLRALGHAGERNWAEVMPAACALTATRRFGQEDLRLITVFVRKYLARHPQSAFSARDLEAVLRGILGEERLVNSVPPGTVDEIMYALLFALADELALSDEQTDGLLTAAEKQVTAAYKSAGVLPEGSPDASVLPNAMHRRTRQPYLDGDDMPLPRVPDTSKSAREAVGRLFGGDRPPRSRGRGRVKNDPPSTLAGRAISASMLRHSEERQRLAAILRERAPGELTRMTRAAFAVAVRLHFRPDAHLREISDLAAATQDAFYPALDLMATEFMVRAVLGEDVPDPGLSVQDEVLAKMFVLGALADWWERDEAAVNAMILQAEAEIVAAGDSFLVVAEN